MGIFALIVIGAVLAVAGARDVLGARDRLVVAKATLDRIVADPSALTTPQGRANAVQELDTALDEVNAAHHLLSHSLSLDVARFIPFASTERAGAVHLVNDTGIALKTAEGLINEADQLVSTGSVKGGQVPIGTLGRFQVDLHAAGATISGLARSSGGLHGPLGRARRQFNTLARSTGARLLDDADALQVGNALLGSGGVRHYFIAVENNAEMRDQGTVLSYAALTVDNGHLQVTDHGPITTPIQLAEGGKSTALTLRSPAPVTLPAGTQEVFGSITPTQTWQSVNASADFALTGREIQAMYHQATGLSVDGVIAVDVRALASLLSIVGPINVPGVNKAITPDDATTVLLHDLYDTFPTDQQQVPRHEVLSDMVSAAVDRLSAGSFDPLPIAEQLAQSAAGGHLRVWSGVGHEEQTLERVGLGGGPGVIDAGRTFHVAVEDRDASKVDYYVETTTKQEVSITPTGTAIVRTTVTVTNGAPTGAAPSYQLGPDHVSTTQPGEYWAWVLLWGPAGSEQGLSVTESGLQLTQTILHTFAGQTASTVFDTVIPNAVQEGKLALRYVPQPRLAPPALTVSITAPGWTITGNPTWTGWWSRAMTLSWSLHRP